MTDLILSEESKQYQDLARDFFQNEIASKSEKLDHEGTVPLALYKAAWELGLASALIPEEFGGLGLSLWDSAVMAEEAGKSSGGFSLLFESNILAIAPLLVAGSKEQQAEYFAMLTEAPGLASYVISPSLNLSSSNNPAAVVLKNGDEYQVSGSALLGLNGENASWYLLAARDKDNDTISLFAIPAKSAGIKSGAQISKLGRRCADINKLTFESVKLSKANLIGSYGDGANILLKAGCISNTIISAHATGTIAAALEHSIKYSKERQTFGKPIASHQAVSFMLADMAKNAMTARLLTWKAASLFDQGKADHLEAQCARVFAVDAAMAAATDAVQIFGGYGYSKEYPVERLMRDAKMMQMIAGTSFELKCRIGDEVLSGK